MTNLITISDITALLSTQLRPQLERITNRQYSSPLSDEVATPLSGTGVEWTYELTTLSSDVTTAIEGLKSIADPVAKIDDIYEKTTYCYWQLCRTCKYKYSFYLALSADQALSTVVTEPGALKDKWLDFNAYKNNISKESLWNSGKLPRVGYNISLYELVYFCNALSAFNLSKERTIDNGERNTKFQSWTGGEWGIYWLGSCRVASYRSDTDDWKYFAWGFEYSVYKDDNNKQYVLNGHLYDGVSLWSFSGKSDDYASTVIKANYGLECNYFPPSTLISADV